MHVREDQMYSCHGPFQYGTNNAVCVHGWNCPHAVSEREAQKTDHLTNCGLLPARQEIKPLDQWAGYETEESACP